VIYTFYSYKGGVGRTMALANIADLLHQHGLKVLVVDGELESPDIERYFPTQHSVGSHLGLINLILDFKKIMSEPADTSEGKKELSLPDLRSYLVETGADDGPPILLMPAGKREGVDDFESYAKSVRLFDWKDFYKNWEGEYFFKWLKQEFSKLADVVLINSCSGISEIGNICTQEMADVVVFFCGSNQQSLDSTLKIAASLTGPQKLKALSNRLIDSIIVPARIEERVDAQLVQNFKRDLIEGCVPFLPPDKAAQGDVEYFWNLRIPNVPRFTFTEGLIMRTPVGDGELAFAASLTKVSKAMARLAPADNPFYKLCDDEPVPISNPQPVLPEGTEPYRGLSPFMEEHFALFFGRSAEIKELLGYVNNGGLVAVLGPSGSGKSSLVQAGLLPRLRRGDLEGSKHWKIVTVRFDKDPFAGLAHAFAPLLREVNVTVDSRLDHILAEENDKLRRVIDQVLQRQPRGARLLLILDQFEELFALAPEDQPHKFLMRLLTALENPSLTVIVTLRSDFHAECQQYAPFYEAMNRQTVHVNQMSRHNLKESVTRPAELMGVTFEPGLADRILDDVGTKPGSLPLLQFALTQLWLRRDGMRLTHQVYIDIGGVQKAVAQRAEYIYQRLSPDEQRLAQRIFTQLVQLNQGDRNTRKQMTYAELGEPAAGVKKIVGQLSEARLLVVRETDEESSKE